MFTLGLPGQLGFRMKQVKIVGVNPEITRFKTETYARPLSDLGLG